MAPALPVLFCHAASAPAFCQLFSKAPCHRHQTSLLCANHHTMQKAGTVDRTPRYGRARISQRDGITSANRKRRFECRRPERYQEFPGVGVRSIKGFNDHPACVFGLSFTMHNSAEPIQIESGDVVLALPFKVNAQSTCGGFAVYAHRDCCIPESFHTSRSFRLFLLEFLFVYRRRNRDKLFQRFHPPEPRSRADSGLSFSRE